VPLHTTVPQIGYGSEPAAKKAPLQSNEKLHFDTAMLRDLVAHVALLTRRLAEIIRNAENPSPGSDDRPEMAITTPNPRSSPSSGHSGAKGHKSAGMIHQGINGKENQIAGQMQMMAVV